MLLVVQVKLLPTPEQAAALEATLRAANDAATRVSTLAQRRCADIMIEVCDSFGAELVAFNGEDDHVRLLVHNPPKVALSTLVNSLKGVSARLLRKEHPAHIRRYLWDGHFWSPSYFAASCGGAPLSIIKEYIDNQKRPD